MVEALGHKKTAKRSSFFLPMWFMSPARRRALHRLYDFCRCVDDAVDEVEGREEAYRGLDAWKHELHAVYHGTPVHPAAKALQQAAREYAIPEPVLLEMMKGFETDCAETVAFQEDSELERYCTRVAGCVGVASLPIFGVSIDANMPFAVALGHALQLTNILRDLDEDLARGRCYIPQVVLTRFGITAQDAEVRHAASWNQAATVLAGRAEAYFRKTHQLVARGDRRRLIPALLMRDAYHLLLTRMRVSGQYFGKPGKITRGAGDVGRLLLSGIRYGM